MARKRKYRHPAAKARDLRAMFRPTLNPFRRLADKLLFRKARNKEGLKKTCHPRAQRRISLCWVCIRWSVVWIIPQNTEILRFNSLRSLSFRMTVTFLCYGPAYNVPQHGKNTKNAGSHTTNHEIVIQNEVKSDSDERSEGSPLCWGKTLQGVVKAHLITTRSFTAAHYVCLVLDDTPFRRIG